MVRGIVEAVLGPYGVQILKLYEANSLWVNSLVVAYGLAIVLSWANLKHIRARLLAALIDQLESLPRLDPAAQPAKLLRRVSIPWAEAVRQARFPFVAQQSALWPRRASPESVQALLPPEDLVHDALKALAARRARAARG